MLQFARAFTREEIAVIRAIPGRGVLLSDERVKQLSPSVLATLQKRGVLVQCGIADERTLLVADLAFYAAAIGFDTGVSPDDLRPSGLERMLRSTASDVVASLELKARELCTCSSKCFHALLCLPALRMWRS